MARNKNDWYKFHHQDYLNSERVMCMSLAAEGLYNRCLHVQVERGNLPADLRKLAMVLQKPYDEVQAVWPEVAHMFETEQDPVTKEDRVYNATQRAHMEEIMGKQDNYSNGSKKGHQTRAKKAAEKPKQNREETEAKPKQNPKKPNQNPSIRASASLSVSNSASKSDSVSASNQIFEKSFARFWEAYPLKEGEHEARAAWLALKPDKKLADEIIAHVQQRSVRDSRWVKEGGKYIKSAVKFLEGRRWTDDYLAAEKTAPPASNWKRPSMPAVGIRHPPDTASDSHYSSGDSRLQALVAAGMDDD